MAHHSRPSRLTLAAGAAVLLTVRAAPAQSAPQCAPLCAPTIALMPALLRSHLGGGPRVQATGSNAVTRLPSVTNMELVIVASARTAIPRTTLIGSVQWLPNASEARNPFTEYSAGALGGDVHADAPTVSAGVAADLVSARQTNDLVDLDVFAGDLFSPASKPDDRRAYTHKLDVQLIANLHAFDWAPPHTYAHRLRLIGILDYVATGVPHAGDEVPRGRRFLDDARPLSFIAGLSIPITPDAQ